MLINEFYLFIYFQTIVTQVWIKNDSLSLITQDWASPSQIWARCCPDLCILRSWPWQDALPPIRGLTADVKWRISAGKKNFFWWSGFWGLSSFFFFLFFIRFRAGSLERCVESRTDGELCLRSIAPRRSWSGRIKYCTCKNVRSLRQAKDW